MSKLLELKRSDQCATCGAELPVGTTAYWYKSERVTRCVSCHPGEVDQTQATAESTKPTAAPSEDVAGASANAEYRKRAARERRRQEKQVERDAAWRTKVKSEHRLLGPIVTVFTPKPVVTESQATKAWKVGAEGEERVAEVLTGVPGIEVLHDRQWPGTRSANIDHVVVGPSGVFVVDAKKYRGRLEVVDKGTLFRPDWRLRVNGRDQTKLVESMLAQVHAVRGALSELAGTVPVSGVLCFTGAVWELIPRPKTVKDVTVLWPLKLPQFVTAPGSVDVAATATHLRSVLAPAR